MKLKKVIEEKKEGEFIFTKTRVIKLEESQIVDLIDEIIEREDDPESQYFTYGIATGFDGELVCVDLDQLCNQIKEELKNDLDDRYLSNKEARSLIKFCNKWKGYTLWG